MWMRSRDGFYGRDKDDVTVEVVDILFAPHHGRDTGNSEDWLADMNRIVIIGERHLRI